MFEPKPIKGAKALLFERLADENPQSPGEAQPFRIYGVGALRRSVERELVRLLNTRCPLPGGPADERERTVVGYGIPDFSHLGPASTTDIQRLAQMLERAITAYEPRLQQVQVALDAAGNSQSGVRGAINANLVVGSVNEPVSFPLVLWFKTGEVMLGNRVVW
jgi:type VI secretion system protein ImpF